MKVRVFLDAFAECLVGIGMARRYPELLDLLRRKTVACVAFRHGDGHADAVGRMFDRMWSEAQNPHPR